MLLNGEFLIIDNEKRTADTTSVGVYADLGLDNVSYDTNFGININHSTELAEGGYEQFWITMNTHPISIDENLARGGFGNDRRQYISQVLSTKLLQELHDGNLRRSRGNVGHEGHVLHQADGLTLGCFGGTYHPPVGVVKLTRLSLFPRAC